MGLWIRLGKYGFELDLRLGNLLKVPGNVLTSGIQGTGDIWVVFNVELGYEVDDGEHGLMEVFEAL